MRRTRSWSKIAGLILQIVVGGMMLAAGSAKLLGLFPPEALAKHGLQDVVQLIGAGEVITAILLLIPRTSSLGILLTSSFWGGAICIHMSHAEPYGLQALLLILSWVGAYLRNPATFSSFSGSPSSAPRVPGDPAFVEQ